MGCPDYYFEESLRNFAYIRNMMTDKAKADYLYNDAAIEEVKDELKKQKDALKKEEEPEYYFDAGVAYQLTMDEAEKDGIDAVNAALGGIYQFAVFIFGKNIFRDRDKKTADKEEKPASRQA